MDLDCLSWVFQWIILQMIATYVWLFFPDTFEDMVKTIHPQPKETTQRREKIQRAAYSGVGLDYLTSYYSFFESTQLHIFLSLSVLLVFRLLDRINHDVVHHVFINSRAYPFYHGRSCNVGAHMTRNYYCGGFRKIWFFSDIFMQFRCILVVNSMISKST